MDSEVKNWLDIATQDLGVAKHLFNTYFPLPLEIICYHCQQAAEKAIKAILLNKNSSNEIPRKHDISFLMNQISSVCEIPELYYDYADTLNPYGVGVRYPNELNLQKENAVDAIKYAEEI